MNNFADQSLIFLMFLVFFAVLFMVAVIGFAVWGIYMIITKDSRAAASEKRIGRIQAQLRNDG